MSPLSLRGHDEGSVSFVLKVVFWIHQVFLGLPSVAIGADLLVEGKTEGIINAIGLLLAWIGGTLVFGLAAFMYRRPIFDLPPVFATIAENVARVETMQARAGAVRAVAEAVERSKH